MHEPIIWSFVGTGLTSAWLRLHKMDQVDGSLSVGSRDISEHRIPRTYFTEM
jgi:hypothetical protein